MGHGAYVLNVAFRRMAPRKVTFVSLYQNGPLGRSAVLLLCDDNHRTGIRDRAERQSALDNGYPHSVEAGGFRSCAIAFGQRGAPKAAEGTD